jgi:hypothetical protein
MGSRRTPRGRGRPRLIGDEAIEKRLIDATAAGAPMAVAAPFAGISERAFVKWMERGYVEKLARDEGQDPDPDEDVYVAFYEKILAARAQAGMRSLTSIQKAAVGGTVTEETTETLPDGTVRKTIKRQPPDWRAGAWFLERQYRPDFGKQDQVAVTGAGGGPVQVEHVVNVDDLTAKLMANLNAQAELTAGPGDDVVDGEVIED